MPTQIKLCQIGQMFITFNPHQPVLHVKYSVSFVCIIQEITN